jgi:hypothetical protein
MATRNDPLHQATAIPTSLPRLPASRITSSMVPPRPVWMVSRGLAEDACLQDGAIRWKRIRAKGRKVPH